MGTCLGTCWILYDGRCFLGFWMNSPRIRARSAGCQGHSDQRAPETNQIKLCLLCSWYVHDVTMIYNDIQWCSCFLLKFVAEILLDAQDSQKVENFRRLSTRTSIEYQYTVYTVYQCLPSQYSGRFWMLMTGCFTSWCTKGGGEAKLWLNPRFPYHGAVSVKTYAWSNWCFSFCSGRQGKNQGIKLNRSKLRRCAAKLPEEDLSWFDLISLASVVSFRRGYHRSLDRSWAKPTASHWFSGTASELMPWCRERSGNGMRWMSNQTATFRYMFHCWKNVM